MMSLTYIIGQVSAPIGEFYGILSIFLLEFIIPKFQQKRRDLFSIDIHTIYGRRNKTAKKDSMTMAVLQSRCLSGVRMKDISRERRNHVAAMTERSLESHLSVMESYRRKTRLRVLSMRTRRKRKIQSLPCSPPCGSNHGKHCQWYCRCQCQGRSMMRKVSLGRFIVGLMLVIITVHQWVTSKRKLLDYPSSTCSASWSVCYL